VEHIGVPKEILMKIITQNPKRFLLGE